MTTGPPRVPRARRDADCLLARRYTAKVQKEMELDEKALANLRADRQRFLCKAVENYVQCLEQGEEHDTWVFRLASLWLENGGVAAVNATMKVSEGHTPPLVARMSFSISVPLQKGVKKIPSHKFLPLMYQLAARMGTQMASEDSGFQDVLHSVRLGRCSFKIKAEPPLHLSPVLPADVWCVCGAPPPHPLHHPRPGQRQQRQGLLQHARLQGRPLAALAPGPGEERP